MWSDFIWQIVGAFVALLVGAIGMWGGIYLKQRLMKRNLENKKGDKDGITNK